MLEAGTQLGVFKVDREIGRGGMGVVYLAKDTRLGRSVAIKALPAAFVADADRLARFEREARTLAALNHPNVAMILGVEEKDGARFLVLEYVEGRTLQERIDEGPLPVDEALSVCAQIAAGLEVAHDAGVVHRDLKPANVRVTPDGAAKVLDFGLAKTGEGVSGSSAVLPDSPTVTSARGAPTAAGVVMGTAGYMSPEQARGRSVDRRTDIWALGCVLYECLTGQSPFRGETASDTMAAVLERDVDWSKLPARTPMRVRELLKRCLEKDVKRRLRDIGDARMELEHAIAQREWTTTSMAAATGDIRRGLPWLAIGAVAVAVVAAAGGWMLRGMRTGSSAAAAQSRLSIVFPDSPRVLGISELSRDRKMLLVYGEKKGEVGGGGRATKSLYTRRMDEYQLTEIKGTEGVRNSGLSPDGQWVAIAAVSPDRPDRSVLKKVPIAGGPSLTLYDEPEEAVSHLVWTREGMILFVAGKTGTSLKSVSAQGGKVREIAELKTEPFGVLGIEPVDGGKWVLLTSPRTDAKGWRQQTQIVSLDDGTARMLLEDGAYARAVSGLIVYAVGDTLMAQRFDRVKGECLGGAEPVIAGLRSHQGYAAYQWALTPGELAYVPGGRIIGKRRISGADMNGKIEQIGTLPAEFESQVIASPDGKLLAGLYATANGTYGVFVYDPATDALRRMPLRGSDCSAVSWTPDSANLVFGATNESEHSRLYIRSADGSDAPRMLQQEKDADSLLFALGVTPDGKWCMAGRAIPKESKIQIVGIAIGGLREEKMAFEFGNLSSAALSPDGKWVAYVSQEGGQDELVVRANALVQTGPDEAKVRASVMGSGNVTSQMWSRDGKTLYFVQDKARQMAVDVTTTPSLRLAPARQLFEWDKPQVNAFGSSMTADGKRFLFIEAAPEERFITHVNLVEGWAEGLAAKLGEGK